VKINIGQEPRLPIFTLLDYCAEKSVIISMDDKAKVDIGKTAVSKYVKASKLFLKGGESSLPDQF